jgi:MoaA/NifB/PqqE/SkfB family radical SAM enzyme
MGILTKFKTSAEKLIPEHPRHIVIQITNTCFFRCKMCSIWKNNAPDQLNVKKISQFLKGMRVAHDEDMTISFTGGETLSCPSIFELISCANKNRYNTILNTNGWLLNKNTVNKLLGSGLSQVAISLDGSVPEIHDSIRGMPGSFDRIMKGIKNIKSLSRSMKKKVSIGINCVIFQDNLHDIVNLAQFAEDNKDIDAVHFQAITAPFAEKDVSDSQLDWYKHKNYSPLWINEKEKLRKAYAGLLQMKRNNYKISDTSDQLKMQYNYFLDPDTRLKNTECSIYKDLFIDQEGNVFHCHIKDERLGNINTDSFEEIWNSKEAFESRKNIKSCTINCHQLLNCGIPE